MIYKIAGVVVALMMIIVTVILIGLKFKEYGFGLPFFFVSTMATFSLLTFGSVVVLLSFYIDTEIAETEKLEGKK